MSLEEPKSKDQREMKERHDKVSAIVERHLKAIYAEIMEMPDQDEIASEVLPEIFCEALLQIIATRHNARFSRP